MQHMVQALVPSRPLKGQHIHWLLHHAQQTLIPGGICTDGTGRGLRDIVAFGAEGNMLFELNEGLCQSLRLLIGCPQKVEGQTGSSLGANARQAAEFLDETSDRLWYR